ncbi:MULTISPECIES: hypothetical protein [Bacillus]|uniref:hypothetical protein n=1 Tax=Bacillus TaxID=1386 RepID=UPI002026C463|nr:hypothetical protein [Bacillus subtilis]MCL9628485.1 hypothetical protein [Bacillus subtilis]
MVNGGIEVSVDMDFLKELLKKAKLENEDFIQINVNGFEKIVEALEGKKGFN